jgi:hypothetical protein
VTVAKILYSERSCFKIGLKIIFGFNTSTTLWCSVEYCKLRRFCLHSLLCVCVLGLGCFCCWLMFVFVLTDGPCITAHSTGPYPGSTSQNRVIWCTELSSQNEWNCAYSMKSWFHIISEALVSVQTVTMDGNCATFYSHLISIHRECDGYFLFNKISAQCFANLYKWGSYDWREALKILSPYCSPQGAEKPRVYARYKPQKEDILETELWA